MMIYAFDEDFSKVTFYANEIGILGLDLDEININDNDNFCEDHPDTVNHFRILPWHNKFEKRKILIKK